MVNQGCDGDHKNRDLSPQRDQNHDIPVMDARLVVNRRPPNTIAMLSANRRVFHRQLCELGNVDSAAATITCARRYVTCETAPRRNCVARTSGIRRRFLRASVRSSCVQASSAFRPRFTTLRQTKPFSPAPLRLVSGHAWRQYCRPYAMDRRSLE